MGSRREVTLNYKLFERCKEYGQRMVDGYAAGRNAGSRALSSRGAEANAELQTTARMAEVAFCLWADLDPLIALNWSGISDDGFDVLFHGYRIDIKQIGSGKRFLIWPVNKRHFYCDVRANAFVLVRGDGPEFCVHKWITKAGFFCEKKIAPTTAITTLDPGTWFMDEKDLWDIGYLCALTRHSEAA